MAAPGDPVVAELSAALPTDRILTDSDVVTAYLHDEAEWAEHGRARAVVRPVETAEVAAAVAICARHRIPVVPRGAGTGLSGGANAVEGGIVRHDVLIANIAHAGDGNLHALLITKQGDEAARGRAQAAFDDIVDVAIDLGGTVTGEHGVGLLKRTGMHRELGPALLAMQRAVKAAFDLHDILNPAKAVG